MRRSPCSRSVSDVDGLSPDEDADEGRGTTIAGRSALIERLSGVGTSEAQHATAFWAAGVVSRRDGRVGPTRIAPTLRDL
jgi:hypothetical protein